MSVPESFTDQLSDQATPNTSRPSPFSLGARLTTVQLEAASSDIIEALSSPEDGINKSLVIDMKDLVGDAVGNVRCVYGSSSSLVSPDGR